ncbi:unnamed protein product [Rhizophagus irregularis]|nr:unnamed protein product [Rhizophagus irregularis]
MVLSENVLATLRQQEVAGLDFFQWTIEKLRSEPYSLPDGLATILVTLINDLNTQKQPLYLEQYPEIEI